MYLYKIFLNTTTTTAAATTTTPTRVIPFAEEMEKIMSV